MSFVLKKHKCILCCICSSDVFVLKAGRHQCFIWTISVCPPLSLCHTEVWPPLIIHLLHYVIFNRAGNKVEAQQQQQQKGQDVPTAVCWSRVQHGQTSCSSLLCWHKIRSLKWGRAKQQAHQFSSSETQTPPAIHILSKLHLFIYSFMVVYSMRLPL